MYRLQAPAVKAEISPHELSGTFADQAYLGQLVAFLRRIRISEGLSVEALARRARIREQVILQAENGKSIPRAREFKSWSSALGYAWDQVWTESCANGWVQKGHYKNRQPFAKL